MAPESQPGAPGDAPDDATTQADGEWPVAQQYQVVPAPEVEQQPGDEGEAVTVAAAPARRWGGVPPAAAVTALLALLLLAGAFAAWLVTRPDASNASSPPSQSSSTPASTPHQGGGPTGGGTTGSTSTDTSSSTTTTTRTPAAQRVAVPNVVGLPASVASQKLREAKLETRIRLVASSRAEGTVLAQVPGATSEIDAGATVELRVAKRTEPAKVVLPSLVGLDAATAKSRLRALGLHWSVTTRASARPHGTVLAQSPSAGARAARGATVALTVSSGQAQVSVPDVTGLDEASARAQLVDAGFDVSVVDQPTTDPSEDGVVVEQSPTGGSSAAKGSSVTITVGHSS